jgi:hypothetical protein
MNPRKLESASKLYEDKMDELDERIALTVGCINTSGWIVAFTALASSFYFGSGIITAFIVAAVITPVVCWGARQIAFNNYRREFEAVEERYVKVNRELTKHNQHSISTSPLQTTQYRRPTLSHYEKKLNS